MPPHTPRSKSTRSGTNLTPSFTFGLGLLPSFKLTSPRNISLLSSISPHRFFNRFSRGKDDFDNRDGLERPVEHIGGSNADIFNLFSSDNVKDSFIDDISDEKKKFDIDSTADLICTGDSVDLWSLTNDSQNPNLTANLTSINEECSITKDSDFLQSPNLLFLRNPVKLEHKEGPKLESSPLENEDRLRTPSRKRKISDAADSPCKLLAARIESVDSPSFTRSHHNYEEQNSSKIWTPQLDEALQSCFKKYRLFRESQPTDSVAFKYTSQNKILSRMLLNRTGVQRTPKQVSSRLCRLNKSRANNATEQSLDIALPGNSASHISNRPAVLSSPIALLSPIHAEVPHLTLEEFTISFIYKLPIQGVHNFSKLVPTDHESSYVANILELKKLLLINNTAFAADFDKISGKLLSQSVPVHSIISQINFKPNEDSASTPTSPLTNPRSFTIENGNFLSHLRMRLAPNVSHQDFISWKSCISIYKDDEKVLLRSKELINGYKSVDGAYDLQVPFLNNFWAGYLTFLSNGLSAYNDVKSLQIVQIIYDGDDDSYGNIHGYFTYRFDISKMNQGNATVSFIRLESSADLEVDDNATVPASSSPAKSIGAKATLSIDTSLANGQSTPDPISVSGYNATLLHKFDPDYNHADRAIPLSMRPNSASVIYRPACQCKSPDIMDTPTSLTIGSGRHQSAGQIMNHVTPTLSAMPHAPSGNFQQGIQVINQDQFQPSVEQIHQLTMASTNFLPQFVQGVPMVPANVNDGTDMHMRFNPMGNPATVPQAHVLGGIEPPQQWRMMYHLQNTVYTQPPIRSAPASQLQFFPKNTSAYSGEQKRAIKLATTITFGPILGYDPSKDTKEHMKRTKSDMNFHKFLLNPQVMYKPKKK